MTTPTLDWCDEGNFTLIMNALAYHKQRSGDIGFILHKYNQCTHIVVTSNAKEKPNIQSWAPHVYMFFL